MQAIRTVGLTAKIQDEKAMELKREISAWLSSKGIAVIACDPGRTALNCQADLLLCIGGDGTIIRTARRMIGSPIPLAGVNMGRVGFLAELTPENWLEALEEALQKGLKTEKRLALEYTVSRQDRAPEQGYAVNDAVISRSGLARLLELKLSIDGKHLQHLRADGLIIASPTGATAYSSAAGGPMIQPGLRVYSVTAVCPFINKMLPLVLDGNSVFAARVCETGAQPYLTIDGQELFELKCGDTISVRTLPEAVSFASFGQSDYISKLRSSGFITDAPRAAKS